MTGEMEKDVEKPNITLDQLPTEILLVIFQSVDIATLHNSVYNVCTRFRQILDDKFVWKYCFIDRYGENCHTIEFLSDDEIDWHSVMYQADRREHLWTNYENSFRTVVLSELHQGSVDSIHLMENGRMFVSGSRDRSICIYNLEQVNNVPNDVVNVYQHTASYKVDAHGGWVWSIRSIGNDILTGSWDNTIKTWSFENGTVVQKDEYSGNHAVLSMAVQHNVLVASFWGSDIKLFDVRDGFSQINRYNMHKNAVLDVAFHGNYIISASEDRTLGVYDVRKQRPLQRITMVSSFNPEVIPFRICESEHVIYVSDTRGSLHIIHPTSFRRVAQFKICSKSINGIAYAPGMLATTCSAEKYINIDRPITVLQNYSKVASLVGEPVSLAYKHDILAVGGSDYAVQLCIPKSSPLLWSA